MKTTRKIRPVYALVKECSWEAPEDQPEVLLFQLKDAAHTFAVAFLAKEEKEPVWTNYVKLVDEDEGRYVLAEKAENDPLVYEMTVQERTVNRKYLDLEQLYVVTRNYYEMDGLKRRIDIYPSEKLALKAAREVYKRDMEEYKEDGEEGLVFVADEENGHYYCYDDDDLLYFAINVVKRELMPVMTKMDWI